MQKIVLAIGGTGMLGRPVSHGLAEPVFAPTLEALQAELERRYPPPQPVNVNGLPDQLVRQTVERLVAAEAGRVALGRDGRNSCACRPSGARARRWPSRSG
jgi:hypothetical protein